MSGPKFHFSYFVVMDTVIIISLNDDTSCNFDSGLSTLNGCTNGYSAEH